MLTVIGCGNPNRSDDGIGVRVAQRLGDLLQQESLPHVRVFDCGTAGMEVMFAARGSDALFIVDAGRSGTEPGSIYEVPGSLVAEDKPPSFTLHDFRWDHALAAGRRIFGAAFPTTVHVWLVEVELLDFGLALSPAVEAACDKLVVELWARMRAYERDRDQNP